MGYTHYWYREPELNAEKFGNAVADIKQVLAKLGQMGVKLAGPSGKGAVTLKKNEIAFNGVQKCEHIERDLGITWPSPSQEAGGVGTKAKGQWFGGALLMERTCDGNCSHDSFIVDRLYKTSSYEPSKDDRGRIFDFCKTAYKPYDLAVTAALIILKNHLGDAIAVASDGEDKDWRDAGMVCQMVLGYGANFTVEVRQ